MKDWIIGLGAFAAVALVIAAVFLMFYGMHTGATAAPPKYFNHGPQDPHDTQ